MEIMLLHQVLSDDYSKIAFLCADRSICLHAKYGSYYSLRIPRMGRDIAYDCWSCDLFCAASYPDLYRINLEQGRFLSSLSTQSPAINVVSRSALHGLVACGGEDGSVECFDMRKKTAIGRISAAAHSGDIDQEVTSLQFEDIHGYQMAVGSSTGKILIYDMRMSNPVRIKDHMYGSPILDIKWHQTLNSAEPKMISTDCHVIRIWDPETGDNMTSIEPSTGAINDVCLFRESGLLLAALDCSQIPVYFIPALGPAPKWCSYLENLTEEMEEGSLTSIYDDYKFLTKKDIEQLNLTHLIGSNLLRAYMHGFFIDYRLYKKAQALADPFAYDAYMEKRKQEKIEAERASRITIKRKLPKVNRLLAAHLLENEETKQAEQENVGEGTIKKKKNKGLTSDILRDERFKAMFEDKDFEIDEQSAEYLSLHPLAQQATKKRPSLIEEHFEPILQDDEGNSDSEGLATSEDDFEKDKEEEKKNSKRVRLYEVRDERHAEAFMNQVSLVKEDALPLGERVAALQQQQSFTKHDVVRFGPGGSREISFVPRRCSKKQDDNEEPQDGKLRRGIRPLGLKLDKSEFLARVKHGGRGGGRGRGRGRGKVPR
ncbi:nucleolar protein 10-like isoform X2 [Dioscorea cayenensis subsp. rotundata]|uniref:Nucleolar protein 10-like isoform X2 n=1 Tax=Dioscorea cayennensis subsp. rotundata TaxID=55577 RepID=A0AB40ATL1_DIOCR|nr:nucleolar protein 10-like isoform X2 [Dioscorea cayenensis subsp. rotundata]